MVELANCFGCGIPLPHRGVFCPSCATQIKCKTCHAFLEPGANACVECGAKLNVESETPPGLPRNGSVLSGNVIRFEESRTHRSLEARLTDVAVGSLSDPLAAFFTSGIRQTPKRTISSAQPLAIETDAPAAFLETPTPTDHGALEAEHRVLPATPAGYAITDNAKALQAIFRTDDQALKLVEPRLKATSQKDFVLRLPCLYLYAHEILGRPKVSRSELNAALKDATVYDSNAITQITRASEILTDESDLSLSVPGREKAKTFLRDVTNPDVVGSWEPGTKPRRRSAKSLPNKTTTDNGTAPQTKKRKSAALKEPVVKGCSVLWKEQHGDIRAFDLLADKTVEDKGIFALWAISKITGGSISEVSRVNLAKFIHLAFDIKVSDRTLEAQLKKSNKAVHVSGTTFRITPAGTSFIENLIAS